MTEPFELASVRAADDPLGLRAAASRLAGYMFSPVTSRTTSVRQLGLFLTCVGAATPGRGPVDQDQFVSVTRLITIAATRALLGLDLDDRTWAPALLGLPGKQEAVRVARRIASSGGTEEDVTSTLLTEELSQGLWGRYATLSQRLELIVGGRLTPLGEKLAKATRLKVMPGVAPGALRSFAAEPSVAAEDRLRASVASSLAYLESYWPLTIAEDVAFRQALTGQPRGRTVAAIIEHAAHRTKTQLLAALRQAPLASESGTNGETLGELASLARLVEKAVRDLEDTWRDRVLDGTAVSLAWDERLRPLFIWCAGQGLEVGELAEGPVDWNRLDRLHERTFRRRGQRAWTRLDDWDLVVLPLRGGPVELRVAALKSLAVEMIEGKDW